MEIRRTTKADIPRMMEIYAHARQFMAEHGNPNQWGPTNWPPENLIHEDIAGRNSYVCLHEDRIVGTFFFTQGADIEPTYRVIRDGEWLDNSPYGVVHRLASDGTVPGMGKFCLDWAFRQCGHLRIDTHGDNKVMQGLAKKCGFTHCGTIFVVEDPYPRLAFEKSSTAVEQQFNLVAREYDANRRKFIPCYDDFYEGSTKFLAANIAPPERVLDLGAGTGLLPSFWFRQFPQAEYVLVDVAGEMLKLARERFAGMENVSFRVMDYTRQFPDGSFDLITSALSIHHLEDEDKVRLFRRIHAALPEGGLFVNYDQFCAGDPVTDHWFDSYWEKQLMDSELTDHDLELWRPRRKLDRECSVEQETEMLRGCGFKLIKCVYSCQKFAVIAAVK